MNIEDSIKIENVDFTKPIVSAIDGWASIPTVEFS